MKLFISILLLMTSTASMAQNGKATTVKKTFSRATSITDVIQAEPEVIFALLTDAADFPRWNSTLISIEGKIEEGEKIKLKAHLDPKRTFKIKIKEVTPHTEMVWGDAMGKRVFTLEKTDQGTRFTMSEKIGSFMFPLFANKIPSFDATFEQYVADLKKEAELQSATR